jgi:hypothetical protein
MASRKLNDDYDATLPRLDRLDCFIPVLRAGLERRPTTLRATRLGRAQVARALLNRDLGLLNHEAERANDAIFRLAFGREPRPDGEEGPR